MKAKLRYLIILSVLATLGVFAFQVIWLKSSYELSKGKIAADAKTVLDESIVEHKELVAERVRRLLKKAIHPNDIETVVYWNVPDNLHVSLAYRTKRFPNASWTSFKVLKNELVEVQNDPYALLLKRINEGNLDVLDGVYSTFVGIVNYEPNSREAKLQDSLVRCFDLHQDTASLNKVIKKSFEKLNYHFITKAFYQTGIAEIYNGESGINKTLSPTSGKVIEVKVAEKRRSTLTEQLDSLNAYLQKLSKNGDQVYVAKPILDDVNTILQEKVSVIVLVIHVTPSIILKQMLFSLIGSGMLFALLAFCICYMFYTILKQKKLSEIKDDFIGNVSHELKTPVATTLAAIQGMQHFDVLKDEEKTEQYLNIAAKEMQRLSVMIDTILNSAIYEQSDFGINQAKFNLKEMLTEMINTQELNAKTEVMVHLYYQAKEEVFGDKTHLYNVFINLFDNAIKYGSEKVQIKIECIESIAGLKIQVSDNGKGIPIVYQKNIFDKFFRVPSPNDHSVKGHGLGLSYVKNILEKHKGKIRLIKSNGNGSTFEIDLPQ